MTSTPIVDGIPDFPSEDSRPEPLPWERRPTENDTMWDLFQIYLLLPPPRTIANTAAKGGRNYEYTRIVAKNHDWVERARLFDQHVIAELHAEKESRRRELLGAEWDDYLEMRQLWQRSWEDLKRHLEGETLDPPIFRSELHALANTRRTLSDFARRTVGMPTDIKLEGQTNLLTADGELNADMLRAWSRELEEEEGRLLAERRDTPMGQEPS